MHRWHRLWGDAAAGRAAAAAIALAGTAVTHVQQLQALIAGGVQAQAPATVLGGSSSGAGSRVQAAPASLGMTGGEAAGAATAEAVAAVAVPLGASAHSAEQAAVAQGAGSHSVSTTDTLPAAPLQSTAAPADAQQVSLSRAQVAVGVPGIVSTSSQPPPQAADALQAAAGEAAERRGCTAQP